MDYIEKAENEIVLKLKAIETEKIFVHKAPETDEERPEQTGMVSNLFVMYTGSRYGEPRSTHQVSQDEFFQFAVVIESPFLRNAYGIYNIKKYVADALLGFIPSNSNMLTLVSSGYNAEKMEQNSGVFTFTMIFETRGMAIKAIPEPDDWGVTSKITSKIEVLPVYDPPGPYLSTEEGEILQTENNESLKI